MSDESPEGLPEPLTPAFCDLRNVPWMPFYGNRLFNSDLDAEANDAEFCAALKLWWMSFIQVPAASLPDDEAILCKLAGFGRDTRSWRKVRRMALKGFVKCRDGRLYHRFLAEVAIESYGKYIRKTADRDKDRKRLQDWRERKKNKPDRQLPLGRPTPESHDANNGAHAETLSETRFETHGETPSETASETSIRGNYKTSEDKISDSDASHRSRRSRRATNDRDAQEGFEEFWNLYPRKVSKVAARKAFSVAIKKISLAELLQAIRDHSFNRDPNYMPYPATWLNGERWADQPVGSPTSENDRRLAELAAGLTEGTPSRHQDFFSGPTLEGDFTHV